jgi:hypothetical protein
MRPYRISTWKRLRFSHSAAPQQTATGDIEMTHKLFDTFDRVALGLFTTLALAPLLTVAVAGLIH